MLTRTKLEVHLMTYGDCQQRIPGATAVLKLCEGKLRIDGFTVLGYMIPMIVLPVT